MKARVWIGMPRVGMGMPMRSTWCNTEGGACPLVLSKVAEGTHGIVGSVMCLGMGFHLPHQIGRASCRERV